jgi:hypothetical protein
MVPGLLHSFLRYAAHGSVVVLLCLITRCSKQSTGSTAASSIHDGSQDTPEMRMDKHGEEIMASSGKQEARRWLREPNHLFFKSDSQTVGQFVEDFYSAGASKVLISDFEDRDGNQYAGSILVVLPQEDSAREKVFDVGMRADIVFGQDPVIDRGQKYLYYTPD